MDKTGWPHERLLDVRGLACPLPVLKLRKVLATMPPGARLLVAATDPMTPLDIPHFCRHSGHRVLEQREKEGVYEFLIERGTLATGSP